ncbi:unnamed protein product [Rhodiola kirilowii]
MPRQALGRDTRGMMPGPPRTPSAETLISGQPRKCGSVPGASGLTGKCIRISPG